MLSTNTLEARIIGQRKPHAGDEERFHLTSSGARSTHLSSASAHQREANLLAPDVAVERLKAFRDERGEHARLATASLPSKLRAIGYGLSGLDASGVEVANGREASRLKTAIAAQLESLRPNDRLSLLSVLFPRLAPIIENAWQTGKRGPYQTGYLRRAFRAPAHPAVTLSARMGWLIRLHRATRHYPQDVTWFAAWAPYLGSYTPVFAELFAAAIDSGGATGQETFDILCASARGEHPVGAMGPHVTRGLLLASRPDGWEVVERLLRETEFGDGVRQSILEAADTAHPRAFRRIVRLIATQDVAPFNSVLRALNAWMGSGWNASTLTPVQVNAMLNRLLVLLDDARQRHAALAGGNAQDAYFALWAMAYDDAPATVPHAAKLLQHRDSAMRAAAARLLGMLQLITAQAALVPALTDPDLRVAALAVDGLLIGTLPEELLNTDLLERLAYLLPRIGAERRELPPVIWVWLKPVLSRDAVEQLLRKVSAKGNAVMPTEVARAFSS